MLTFTMANVAALTTPHTLDPDLRARRDALFASQIDAMVSRRHRRPISLPRPPQFRGR